MKPHPDLPSKFADLGIELALLKGLHKAGFETPTDIQREMIPLALQGRDVMGQARTGTGKTAAFALPIMQQLDPNQHIQAVVIVPTRELAVQVTAEMRRLAVDTPLQIVPIYGGQAIQHQVKLLHKKTQAIVATPGRVMDLLNRGIISFNEVKYVVLDEVDRMLDIGFIDDIRNILGRIRQKHQTIFVTATFSEDIKQLARQFMNDPAEANVSRDELTVESVEQVYCSVERWDKFQLLRIIMKTEKPKLAIVFTNTKHNARKLAKKLHQLDINVKEIHGDLVQSKRERVMERFRRHAIDVLVATDLASRGIDVQDISHIINYDIPFDPQIYVHRIGRTARMGAFGRAITFVAADEGDYLTAIEVLIDKQVELATFEDFRPRPPREMESEAQPKRAPRGQTAVFSDGSVDTAVPKAAPPKTLGSKFRPRRKRR